ncbi:YbaB/EbfC family nucleoid-associated protein [Actinoplanes sp. NPDC051475]|uniref:YbaB/EbfC family nucleoid-associated protein n=1 Tax=Actinoplanes sp. NPDC051475 TaxID=3157225 RepID=UPI00344EE3B7
MTQDDDPIRGLQQLQRDAEDLARRFSAAASAGAHDFTGTDRAGMVTIAIEADGKPVDVTLRPEWRDKLSASQLPEAITEAYTNAVTARLSAWAEGMAQPSSGEAEAVEPEWQSRVELGDPSSRQSTAAIRDLVDLLNEVDSRMPDFAASVEASATRSITGENVSRTVRVTMTGGALAAVSIDSEWLRTSQHDRIADAVAEALAAAHRAARDERERIFDESPAFGRLQRLTASPQSLLREIGLIR